MSPAEFNVIQKRLGATDLELAKTLDVKLYVLTQWKCGQFRIGHTTALCMRLLEALKPGMRCKFLQTKESNGLEP